jgi:hypothetical protein
VDKGTHSRDQLVMVTLVETFGKQASGKARGADARVGV